MLLLLFWGARFLRSGRGRSRCLNFPSFLLRIVGSRGGLG